MAIPRVIPVLLVQSGGLVKTVQFKNPKYIGDPLNAVRIFNEKEVDELILLNISAAFELQPIPFESLREIAEECFMPLAYGGGIKTLEDIRALLKIGMEKVVINSLLYQDLKVVKEAITQFGSSTIVASLDVKKNFWGTYELHSRNGKANTKKTPVEFAVELEQIGVGELMIQSVDRDGTMKGYDLELISEISSVVQIPVIACGGANTIDDFDKAINHAGASAVAAGSMFVFHGKHKAVLITYPDQKELKRIF
ncbi:AglZ/HisF2 family acetamidino modification protein [Fluviicola sp.]|uniref:AglZ/HisF2 family acetamidino modification protein n=1 Tax=Fluviicola sp. TaxID=1917219 RepID=UPI0026076A4B|nr:AglZ/HisF2 family acetamidino modification protein [Fluviicola sp.]